MVRVRKTEGPTTTLYLGAAVEVQIRGAARVTTTYYFFGSQRVAMRVTTGTITGTVTWLHGDHLGSASLATNASGRKVAGSDARYTPFGEYRAGLAGAGNASDNRFTGQKRLTAGWGLDDFNARMYSAAFARFVSADTIVPGAGEPQNLNRLSALGNNPLKYVDPTGHAQRCWNAAKSEYRVCAASGDIARFENRFKAELTKTRLGKELLTKQPKILELVLWDFWVSKSAASTPASSLNGDKYYSISIPQDIYDAFVSGSPLANQTSLIAHEIFHVYQRELDSSRSNVFTTKQMEREAYAFQYGIEWDLTEASQRVADSRRAPWLGTANSAYQQLLDDAWPKSLSDLGRLPTYLQYLFAPDGTRHGGNLNAALTIDLGFSSQAIQSIYDTAGVPMPPP